jgi:hypothetical protein
MFTGTINERREEKASKKKDDEAPLLRCGSRVG